MAASHWHQEIGFRPEKVHNWNLKAAYTTCLLSDATVAMETALDKCSDVFAISECLINGAKFTSSRVAAALLQHFEKYYSAFTCTRTSDRISYETSQDIFGLLTDEMLKNILRLASEQEACETADFCLAYAAHESLKRKLFLVPEYKRAMRQRLGCSTWVQRSYEWQRVSVEMN